MLVTSLSQGFNFMRRFLIFCLSPAMRTTWRVCFVLYAIALVTATHWPALTLEVPGLDRPDLLIHMTAFGGWFGLFWLSGFVGPPGSWRSIRLCVLIAVVVAAIDEYSQGIPGLKRTVAWDDFFSNCAGIAIGAAVASVVYLLCRPRGAVRDD